MPGTRVNKRKEREVPREEFKKKIKEIAVKTDEVSRLIKEVQDLYQGLPLDFEISLESVSDEAYWETYPVSLRGIESHLRDYKGRLWERACDAALYDGD